MATAEQEPNVTVAADRYDDFASTRIPISDRRGPSSVFMILFGIVTSYFFLTTGGSYLTTYGATATWIGLVIGFFVLVSLAFITSKAASREGLTSELITRACGFGYFGTILTSLIYAATFIFYTAIEGQILAEAAASLIPLPEVVWYVIAGLVFIPLVWKGTTQLSWMMWVTIPVYIILVTWAAVAALGLRDGFPVEMFQADAPGGMAGAVAVSGVMAGLAGTIGLNPVEAADYNRYIHPSKYNRSFWVSVVLPYFLMFFFAMPLGMFLAAVTGSINPAEQFVILIGAPAAALLAWISQVRINLTNVHLGSIALTGVSNRIRHSPKARRIWTIVICVLTIPLMYLDIVSHILPFLAFSGVFLMAWVGCVVSDLIFVRRVFKLQSIDLVFEEDRLHPINPVGPVALVGGVTIGTVLLFIPGFGIVGSYAAYIGFGTAVVLQVVGAAVTRGKYYVKEKSDA